MLNRTKKISGRIFSVITSVIIAMVAMFSSIPTASAADGVSQEELREIANELAILINEARHENNLLPYYSVPYLNECAEIRAEEAAELVSHTRPDGSYFSTAVDKDILYWGKIFENLAGGADNAKDTLEQWKGSTKHWNAILNKDFTHIGTAVYYDPDSPHKYYWIIIFTNNAYDRYAEYEGQYLATKNAVKPIDYGDIDGNSTIDSFDYITLLDYLHKRENKYPCYFNELQVKYADCFEDGLITISDAVVMKKYLLGEISTLPYKFF